MINILTLSSFALTVLHMAVAPASAHGYVSHPPSRQARCKAGEVPGCGPVRDEPQSVEGLHGSFKCNGNGARFPELNDEALWLGHFFTVPSGVDSLDFTWTLPMPHRTTTFEYFTLTDEITLLASFNYGNTTPPSTLEHPVPLNLPTGRQTILARWNVGDTPNSFYSCVDLHIDPEIAVADAATMQLPIGILRD